MGGCRMTRRGWSWAGACSIGTSHVQAGLGCDDAAACVELTENADSTLIVVVSDGAGSAEFSRIGSRIVAREFCRAASSFILKADLAANINEGVAKEWIDNIRDRISQAAVRAGSKPQAFAATLVGCIVQREKATTIHIGDGACALRLFGERSWTVPSWPAQGEFAGTTYFVTDDPEARTNVVQLQGVVEEIAVFTDGLEGLALDFISGSKRPFEPFFESIFPEIRKASPGRQRNLSRDLRSFLDSARVTDRTSDDKTLIMARRVAAM
jgi:hypothetical protein